MAWLEALGYSLLYAYVFIGVCYFVRVACAEEKIII